ncbi:MAG: phosphoenolpyruvate--protein phosphotransferase [Rhodospirillales bacterium]|nr:phosphoenolpyruvate--protein phosphotransferase [Rhodospirillales bacterium]
MTRDFQSSSTYGDAKLSKLKPSTGNGLGSSRRLLSRLRDVMAEGGQAQKRLDRIVTLIATDIVAEVCSIYLLRAGEVLELFATEGLKSEAVHNTRLRIGEGLIGTIAAQATALTLSEAQNHPAFAYRPETGEEIFHSMMGVPIMHSGRVVGVLAVQNQTQRHYTEEELETLETVAMVLAELVSGGELVPKKELQTVDGIAVLPMRLDGTRLSEGVGMGQVVLHRVELVLHNLVAEDPEAELERLHDAVADMHGALDNMLESNLIRDGEHRDVLETYRLIAEDAGWLNKISDAIKSGLKAEAAVQKIQTETRLRMNQISDPYLKERVQDFEDLANRLLQHLMGETPADVADELPDHVVLVAKSMGPAELMDYDTDKLRALVLEEGSPTSHVAIVARALDIPVLGRVKSLMKKVEPLDTVVVDGDNNQIFVRPSDDIIQAFKQTLEARAEKKAGYLQLKGLPTQTLDGQEIDLFLNAGLLIDLQHLEESDADGVGLYRTEIPFMARSELPDVDDQTQLYEKIYSQSGNRPVVFRTLDAGGDKVLPYWESAGEENPALGWRAIRLTLDRPAILRQQIRALVLASAGRELQIMFPMIAEVQEFIAARRLVEMEVARSIERGEILPSLVKVGAMLEVPSLLFQMPQLLKEVDFLSIGSNDLIQFLFACDRGNPSLASRYDSLSGPVLTVLRDVLKQCNKAQVPVSLCGEMGGRPIDAMALVGIGFTRISMSPPALGPVKTMIRSLELTPLKDFMENLYTDSSHSVREKLRSFALDHNVVI